MPAGLPGGADGLPDAGQDSSRSGAGSPGGDLSPASQPSRFIRSRRVVIAIVLAIAMVAAAPVCVRRARQRPSPAAPTS